MFLNYEVYVWVFFFKYFEFYGCGFQNVCENVVDDFIKCCFIIFFCNQKIIGIGGDFCKEMFVNCLLRVDISIGRFGGVIGQDGIGMIYLDDIVGEVIKISSMLFVQLLMKVWGFEIVYILGIVFLGI